MRKPSSGRGAATRRRLQLDEDMAFQRRNWAAERIGWAVMGLVVVLALLGLFGAGPLARGMAEGGQGLVRVEYGRFERFRAPTWIEVQVAAAAVTADGIALDLDAGFVDAFEIEGIRPAPRRSQAMAGGLRLIFDATPGEAARLRLSIRPDRIAIVESRLGLPGGDRVGFRQIVYP